MNGWRLGVDVGPGPPARTYALASVDMDGVTNLMVRFETQTRKAAMSFAGMLTALEKLLSRSPTRSHWRAQTAEWLTLYLAQKGPVSTRRIKTAWREKWTLNWEPFPVLREFARDLGFVTGTTWALPVEHPLAA